MARKSITTLLILAFAFPVFAQTPAGFGEKARNARESFRVQTQGTREELRTKTEEVRAQFEAKRQEFKREFEAKKAEVQDRIKAEKTALKDRLTKIKDEKKKQAVERIANEIAELNKRRLDHFDAVLEKMGKFLARVVSRIDKGADRGIDVASPRAGVERAKAAIAAAREAVKNQAGKVYIVMTSTTTESGLKNVVGRARQTFHEDLKKVEDAVKAARDAVHDVTVTLGQIKGIDDEPKATSTNPQ